MAERDYSGDYSRAIVPLKAISAREIIYQASKLMSVANRAGIPVTISNDMMYKEDVVRGRPGSDDVQVDAGTDATRLVYKPTKTNLKWSTYDYLIPYGARLQSRDVSTLTKDAVSSASEYFAAVRDYRIIKALIDGAGATSAATAKWDSANADVEKDITTILASISANSNMKSGEKLSCIMPASVSFEVKKLTLIQNIQRTMEDYLSKSFDINFLAFRPMVDDAGTAILDGLSTSALVFVQGRNTATGIEYSTAEAARRSIPLTEYEKIMGRGDHYLHRIATGAIVRWDGLTTYNETVPLSYRIYKLTTVK